jgi:hypothetical protein
MKRAERSLTRIQFTVGGSSLRLDPRIRLPHAYRSVVARLSEGEASGCSSQLWNQGPTYSCGIHCLPPVRSRRLRSSWRFLPARPARATKTPAAVSTRDRASPAPVAPVPAGPAPVAPAPAGPARGATEPPPEARAPAGRALPPAEAGHPTPAHRVAAPRG